MLLAQTLRCARMRSQVAAVVQLLPGTALVADVERMGVPVITLSKTGWKGIYAAPAKLRALLRSFAQPLVVHSWLYHADLVALCARLGIPRVALVSGLHTTHLRRSAGMFTTPLLRRALALASDYGPELLIACADAAFQVHRDIGFPADRLRLIRNGVSIDPESLELKRADRLALRQSIGLSSDTPIVGMVGRNHPDKNPMGFIRAAMIVADRIGDAHFVMCGRGLSSRDAPELVNAVAAAGLSNRFHFIGERPSGRAVIRALDVFVLSSVTEALPLSVLEAMAAAVPVVATAVGDVPAVLDDRALVVSQDDPCAIAPPVIELLASEQARDKVGSALAARAREYYSLEGMVDQYLAVYRDAIAARLRGVD